MTTRRPQRPLSIADGIFGGVVIALVAITLYSFARHPFERREPLPPGSADELRIEVRDRNDDTNVNLTVPLGFVQGVANLLPDEATVRFDRSLDDLDCVDLWAKVQAAPEGQRIELEQRGKKIAATKLGKLVELEIRQRRHQWHSDAPEPPEAPEPPKPPTMAGSAAAGTAVPAAKAKSASSAAEADDSDSDSDDDGGEEIARIKLPLRLLEKAAGAGDHGTAKIRLADTLRELRGLGPIVLVSVESPNESVRISLE